MNKRYTEFSTSIGTFSDSVRFLSQIWRGNKMASNRHNLVLTWRDRSNRTHCLKMPSRKMGNAKSIVINADIM